jgi:hypothetical protein
VNLVCHALCSPVFCADLCVLLHCMYSALPQHGSR